MRQVNADLRPKECYWILFVVTPAVACCVIGAGGRSVLSQEVGHGKSANETAAPIGGEASTLPNYVVVPIATDLQQLITPGDDTVVCVVVNKNALLGDSPPLDAIDMAKLQTELAVWARRKKGSVYFLTLTWDPRQFGELRNGRFVSFGPLPDPEVDDLKQSLGSQWLWIALYGVGANAGFSATYVDDRHYYLSQIKTYSTLSHPRSWLELISRLSDDSKKSDPSPTSKESEAPVGNALVKAYPVETTLSAVLCGAKDCLIHVEPPLAEIDAKLGKMLPALVDRYVKDLALEHKGEIAITKTRYRYAGFGFHPEGGGLVSVPPDMNVRPSKKVAELFDSLYEASFAKRIGFQRIHRPQSDQDVFQVVKPCFP